MSCLLTFTRSLIASSEPYTNFGGVRCGLVRGLGAIKRSFADHSVSRSESQ
jgi:hypothetical protein